MTRTRPLGPNVTLIRPLLEFRRRDLFEYLESLDQPYCIDATNRDVRFARNRIRHELLPLIERDFRPNVAEALVRLASLAGDAQRVVEAAADNLLDRALKTATPDRVVLDCKTMSTPDRHLVRELFVALWRRQGWPAQDMGFAHWDALALMAIGDDGAAKRSLPRSDHRVQGQRANRIARAARSQRLAADSRPNRENPSGATQIRYRNCF